MKIKNKKEIKKNEFRRSKDTQHPAYIYAREGNKFKFIGITHSKITKGTANIKLDKNPNPNDKRNAYALPKADQAATNKFKSKEKGWKLSKKDKPKIAKIIDNKKR